MKGWVGLVGWPVADGLPTLVVTHQLQVERRTGKVRRPETDVLPLCHAAVYLLLFSVSYYLHSPSTASGARYRRSACIDMDVLRLAAAACCNMGWISAQRGVLCDWTVSKRLEACINAEVGHSEHLLWHCLLDIPVAMHHNRFFSEPPTTTHNWLCSVRWRSFAIHKLVFWHFQVGGQVDYSSFSSDIT